MRYVLSLLLVIGITIIAYPQDASSIIGELKQINSGIAALPCNTGSGNIISNRGMNLFLAGKVGSYLSEESDLSYYKNNTTFNSADGILSLNHSLFQPTGADLPVRSFMVVGVKAGIGRALNKVNKTTGSNEFGFTLRQTWLGTTHTFYSPCNAGVGYTKSQRVIMDALRAGILSGIESDILLKKGNFEESLTLIKSTDIPGQNMDSVKQKNRVAFYSNLKNDYDRKFADMQAQLLLNTNNYKKITSSWTSIIAYIPLIREKFIAADNLLSPLERKFSYPLKLSLVHTRFIESLKGGRLFLSIMGGASLNNSISGNAATRYTGSEYNFQGGKDSAGLIRLNSEFVYMGNYNKYITTFIKGKVVFIPPDWHFGLTAILEKNFGPYNALNGTFGIPIVLIDRYANPSINFEFDIHYFDISNSVLPLIKVQDKVSIGVTIGVPFSKICY